MGVTIFLAYTIQEQNSLLFSYPWISHVKPEKGFCTSPSLLHLSTPYRVPPWVDILRWFEVNLESIVKFCKFF